MTTLDRCFNIHDLRAAAKRRLPRGIFDYVDRGTEDEVALAENRAAFARLRLFPRVLNDVAARSTATTLFGKPMAMPAAIAPMSPAGLMWHEGELALARAAAAAGIPYTLPTESLCPLEKIAEVGGRPWFQLYWWQDHDFAYALIDRVAAAGFEALLLTVDTQVPLNREFNNRSGFVMPFRPGPRAVLDFLAHPAWFTGVIGKYLADGGLPQAKNHPEAYRHRMTRPVPDGKTSIDQALDWDDLARLRDRWPRTLMVKGIVHPEDAARAVALGADGIVVSNHGGRNFDSSIAPIDALPGVVAAVGGRATVLMDSGVRRGSDIAKALILGADAVLLGRAMMFGLSAGGEAGVSRALSLLTREFELTLGHLGCTSPSQLDRQFLVSP